MSDWRNGLNWIPIVVFTILLLASFAIGLAGGYKRALYWTGGNLLLWFIAFIITAAGGNAISESIAKLIRNKVSTSAIQDMSDQDLINAVRINIGWILYLIVAFVGNLCILLPMYFAGFVKWTHIGKYDPRSKKYDAYVEKVATKNKDKAAKLKQDKKQLKMKPKTYFWVSRAIAMPCSVVLALPMISTMTQLAFGGTVEVSKVYTSGTKDSKLKGLFNFTDGITKMGYKFVNNIGKNTSSIISGVNLGINKETNLQDVFDYVSKCMDTVNGVQDSVTLDKIENQIKPSFFNFATYVDENRENLELWLKDLSYSDSVIEIVNSLLKTFVKTGSGNLITEEAYPNTQVFIDGVLNGCEINTLEATSPEIQLGEYDFDWYTNESAEKRFTRIAVPANVYNTISDAMRTACFDPTWIESDPDGSMDAARAVTALFFVHDTNENAEPANLDIIIGPNQIIADNEQRFRDLIPDPIKILDDIITNGIDKMTTGKAQAQEWFNNDPAGARDKLLKALDDAGIYVSSQFDTVIEQIKKNSNSGTTKREDWGNEQNPYIIPIDSLYTFDFKALTDKDRSKEYIDVTVAPTGTIEDPFSITVTLLKQLDCVKTGVFSTDTPLWWSFVPHFNPIYVQPEYEIDVSATGDSQYLNKYLKTNWFTSGDTNSSLSTGSPDTIPTAEELSTLSDNETTTKNKYAITFEYKNKKSGETTTFTKYFLLTTFLKYDYHYEQV